MKTAFVLSALFVGVQSFAVVPSAQTASRTGSALMMGLIPEEEMTPDQREILAIKNKWSEVRHLDREEAEKTLDEEWLAAYNRFYEKYDDDMVRMQEIVNNLERMIEPPRVAKKTKGQKKRDAYARRLARSGGTA